MSTLHPHSTLAEIVAALAPLRRDLISEGYDQAAEMLRQVLPLELDRFPTGSECWSWIIPPKWACRTARLETIDGKTLFSDRDHPLHVMSYSAPFSGTVSREELLQHLHVHPLIPDAIPFVFRYYKKDWGLCCSQKLRDSLQDPEYRVVIESEFSEGNLTVGRFELPGESDETIVLCAHLCHPAQANDDASGVAVGIEVMRRLSALPRRRFRYLFLIVPETIGSVAWLSRNMDRVPTMKSGVFLEMLGLAHPHSVQLSYFEDSEIDHLARRALREEKEGGWAGPLLKVIGNDERQFNAPGVRVPMISVARVLPYEHPEYPFREYHSNHDTPAICDEKQLLKSADLVEKILFMQENNLYPHQTIPGEIFLSRYGLHRDWFADRKSSDLLYESMFRFDGLNSIAEIASSVSGTFAEVLEIARSFEKAGVLEMLPARKST